MIQRRELEVRRLTARIQDSIAEYKLLMSIKILNCQNRDTEGRNSGSTSFISLKQRWRAVYRSDKCCINSHAHSIFIQPAKETVWEAHGVCSHSVMSAQFSFKPYFFFVCFIFWAARLQVCPSNKLFRGWRAGSCVTQADVQPYFPAYVLCRSWRSWMSKHTVLPEPQVVADYHPKNRYLLS
jgi:hypothetical protein